MLQAGLIQLQTDSALLCLSGKNRDAVFQCGTEVKGFLYRRRSSGFQLAYLQNIIYQGEEMLR